MAQDKVPTIAPTKAQPQVPSDSPYYTRDNAPDGITPAARWLLNAGWKVLGDPGWEKAMWYIPGAEDHETAHLEEKKGWVMRQKRGTDANGKPIFEPTLETLYQQDGSPLGVQNVPVEQLTVVPPAKPMLFDEAVRCQQVREEAARRKAQQSAKVA